MAYPLMVYFSIDALGPRLLALVLLIMSLFKLILTKDKTPTILLGYVLLAVFCGGVMISANQGMLKFYPVMMSIMVAAVFFLSLWDDETIIERLARSGGATITPLAKQYILTLTKVWVGLILLNAGVAAYTALYLPLAQWAFYNGFLSYMLFGLFMLAEWLFRQRFKKVHGE